MNKKGFTLIELLAVIVILSLLGLLASNSITKIVKNSKDELYLTQIELIKSAAESWSADNLDLIPESGKCIVITLENLKDYGLIDSDIINPRTNKEFSDNMKIKISSKENKMGVLDIIHEVDSNETSDCGYVYSYFITEYVNDTNYPWSFNDGLYKSTNHDNNSTSNISFNFKVEFPSILKFDWSISSESVSWDYAYYTIKKDGITVDGTGTSTKIGGTNYGTSDDSIKFLHVDKELESGEYQLIFTYSKDGSASTGTDTTYIKNIILER